MHPPPAQRADPSEAVEPARILFLSLVPSNQTNLFCVEFFEYSRWFTFSIVVKM